MVSGCMMRKMKKTEIEFEAEKSAKENGDFMQLRSRRLYKSGDVPMGVIKKRQGSLNSASRGRGRGRGKGKGEDGSGLMRKVEEKVVVVEEEGENVEQVVCFDEGGVAEFDVFVSPIDCEQPTNKAGGGGGGGGGGSGGGGGGGGGGEVEIVGIDGEEGMIGDNLVANDRQIRESTPEHLIVRSNYIIANESNTRAPGGDVTSRGPFTNRRLQGECVPSVKSIENLFAASERQQEKLFMEKYNFDFKNESPLPGRYEWVKVEP